MNIIKLNAENVKRLRAVEITPDGNLVVIGGRNAQGKSSVLDSILYGLAGGKAIPAAPVRRGMSSGSVELDLGELVVRRTFSANGGTTLTVKSKDGTPKRSPQAILDKLVGRVSFDPLYFSRLEPQDQADTLRQLAGLDFTAADATKQKLYDERLVLGRDLKTAEARLAAAPDADEGVPDEEVSAADILVEQSAAAKKNAENGRLRRAVETQQAAALTAAEDLAAAKAEYAKLTAEIEKLVSRRDAACGRLQSLADGLVKASALVQQAKQAVLDLEDIDLSPFAARCRRIEQVNALVREKKQRAHLVDAVDHLRREQRILSGKIEEIENTKRVAIEAAKFPVEGLGFDAAGGVEYRGVPFAQASEAEKIKASVAIGLALNPQLRVLIIRDGSLLDTDSLKTIGEMAAKADAQIWIERVGDGEEVSVVIEDGAVAEPTAAVAAEVNY